MKEGTPGLECHIIYKGIVDIFVKGKLVTTLNDHKIFGELALSSELIQLWSASAVAKTDVTCFTLLKKHYTPIV